MEILENKKHQDHQTIYNDDLYPYTIQQPKLQEGSTDLQLYSSSISTHQH